MRLLSSSHTLDQALTKQILPLRRQLTAVFSKYPIGEERQNEFRPRIEQAFNSAFAQPIPTALTQRVLYERHLVRSIQRQLRERQLILRRTADERNVYYIGTEREFQQQTAQYIADSQWFELVTSITSLYTEQRHLEEMVKTINGSLYRLELNDLINIEHRRRFQIRDRAILKLPQLSFLPDDEGLSVRSHFSIIYLYLTVVFQSGDVSVKPRLSSHRHAPIYALAGFLDRLLRPLFVRFAQATTVTSGAEFIQKLQAFTSQNGCLTINTRFITFRIHHLATRMSQANLLNVVSQFLAHQIGAGGDETERLSAQAVAELIRLVLGSNHFMYDGNVYRFTRGTPANLALCQLLADIYLQDWQRALVRQVRVNQGFYARYQDTGILTWNGAIDTFAECLLALNAEYPDVRVTTSSGQQVHFLDCHIENCQGQLYTRVYHNPCAQIFLLPYANDHPRLMHRQWFRFALSRAIQYCSSYDDFQDERLDVELTFLANGYSLDFVEYHFCQFYARFKAPRASITRSNYASFRTQVFAQVNQQKYEREALVTDQSRRFVRLYYQFDWGIRDEFNKQFRQLWLSIVNEDPLFQRQTLDMFLYTKHCYTSNTLLARANTNA